MAYRSFAALRMALIQFIVVLNEVENLYDTSPDGAMVDPQLSVMNPNITVASHPERGEGSCEMLKEATFWMFTEG